MVQSKTWRERLFEVANVLLLGIAAIICLLPFIQMLAVSLSARPYISAGRVVLWPRGVHLNFYRTALGDAFLRRAFFWSVARTTLGTTFGLLLTCLAAYPLSHSKRVFRGHDGVIALFLFAVLFDAGILAKYVVVRKVGLYDRFWSLVIPSSFSPWYAILLMNFFRELPEELKEAAQLEGANHWQVLFHIYLPLAKPALVTVGLFTGVALWNEWFEPILYLRASTMYPLQTYLQGIFTSARAGANGLQGALSIIAIVPLILIYPFLQRYFEHGIVLGAVKQ